MTVVELMRLLADMPMVAEITLEVGGDGAVHSEPANCIRVERPGVVVISGEPK